jgi:hypothetical protein
MAPLLWEEDEASEADELELPPLALLSLFPREK